MLSTTADSRPETHSNKVVARRATAMMMVIRLWREPDTKHMKMHLHPGWDLGHWIRMISVSGWIGFTSARGWKSKAHQVLRGANLKVPEGVVSVVLGLSQQRVGYPVEV